MKSERELRDKLTRYQGVLADVEISGLVDRPGFFIFLSQHFPEQAIELLKGNIGIDEFYNMKMSEDRAWVRNMLDRTRDYVKEVMGERITMLKWVLEET
jgi:hypothetical protein